MKDMRSVKSKQSKPAPKRSTKAPPKVHSHPKKDNWSDDEEDRCECTVTDELALEIQGVWQRAFPSASLLPVIGLPSNAEGVATLTHGGGHTMKINGLPSKSALANNALYSFECSEGVYVNLYEIMLPDIPGQHGEPSTVEYYTKLLNKYGLSVSSSHYHWWGSFVLPEATLIAAVHHQTTNNEITPLEFSRRTIQALKKTIKLIEERSGGNDHNDDY